MKKRLYMGGKAALFWLVFWLVFTYFFKVDPMTMVSCYFGGVGKLIMFLLIGATTYFFATRGGSGRDKKSSNQ